MERWRNRVAVVTGASSGIGASIVEYLLDAGVVVVGLARRVNRMQDFKNKLNHEKSSNYHIKYCDVSDENSVKDTFEWICSVLGGVDILINNAAVFQDGHFITMDMSDIKNTINTNLLGVIYCTKAAVKNMMDREFAGHIIFISSIYGHNVIRIDKFTANIYPATKWGIKSMNETLRHEFNIAGLNIKVTVSMFKMRFDVVIFILVK